MGNRHEGHIRERTPGTWEIRYTLGNDPLTGKRRTVTATIKGVRADAKKELRARLHSKDAGQHVSPSRQTLAQFLEAWLTDWASVHVSPKTFERYAELIRGRVIPNLGSVMLQKLDALQLTQLYAKLVKGDEKGEGKLSARTVIQLHRVVHRALKHAVLWKAVQSNPAASASVPRAAHVEIEILAPEAIKGLLKDLPTDAIGTIVRVALGTGARRGEILALRWKDVDLTRNTGGQISVEQSLEQTKARPDGDALQRRGLRFKSPKTKHGRRRISLPDFVATALRAFRLAQQEERLALGLGKAPADALVFPAINGGPLRPDNLSNRWAEIAASLGLKCSFHGLRHTHASQLIASGMDVLLISRRLGHANPTITLNIYGHLFPDSDDKAARALDAAFSPAQS